MIYATGRIIRRFPALSLLLTGLCVAASPTLLGMLVLQLCTRYRFAVEVLEFLIEHGSTPFAVIFFLGIGMAAAALGWMVVRLVIYTFRQYPI